MENIGILPGRKKVSAITRCPLYRVSAIDRYDCITMLNFICGKCFGKRNKLIMNIMKLTNS